MMRVVFSIKKLLITIDNSIGYYWKMQKKNVRHRMKHNEPVSEGELKEVKLEIYWKG